MRASTSLFLRDLLSKLHPPSPATPRESQQLLRLLDTSFRRRLDELHPSPRAANQNGSSHDQVLPDHSRTVTSHLDSVLHHPLLEANTSVAEVISSPSLRATKTFEKLLRDGRFNLHALRACCREYLVGVGQGDKVPSNHRLGAKIAAWLSSASGSLKKQFLTDTRAVPVVLRVMYADGLEDVIWNWLSILYGMRWESTDSPALSAVGLLRAEDIFVSAMIRASISRGAFEDAVQQFIKASEYRTTSGRASVKESDDGEAEGLKYFPLLSSWIRMSNAILVKRNKHGISGRAYDNLLGYSITSVHHTISKGFLMLYHPEKPSPQTLFQEFQSEDYKRSWSSLCLKLQEPMQKAFLLAILDAAELSLHHQNHPQSQFFLNLAQAHWPTLVSTSASSKPAERLVRAREGVGAQIPLYTGFALT